MPYRLTGENPSLEVLREFPNWEYALDEEGVEGQDETTLRPASNQSWLGDETVFTLGEVRLADGQRLPAFLELMSGRIEGVTVHGAETWAWSVRRIGTPSRWTAMLFDWLPENERPPAVDLSALPMTVESALPAAAGGRRLLVEISAVH